MQKVNPHIFLVTGSVPDVCRKRGRRSNKEVVVPD